MPEIGPHGIHATLLQFSSFQWLEREKIVFGRNADAREVNRQLACKPGSVWLRRTGTWQPFIWDNACTLPHATHPDDWPGNRPARLSPAASSLFGFAPGGVYRAISVAGDAVGSYPTLSPLPVMTGGLLSVALSLRSPSPDVIRHRVSVEPGLSSPYRLSALVKRGCPANWQGSLKRGSPQKPTKYRQEA